MDADEPIVKNPTLKLVPGNTKSLSKPVRTAETDKERVPNATAVPSDRLSMITTSASRSLPTSVNRESSSPISHVREKSIRSETFDYNNTTVRDFPESISTTPMKNALNSTRNHP